MLRLWTIAMLAALPMIGGLARAGGDKDGKDIKIEGKLADSDPKDTVTKVPCKVHPVKMKAGTIYVIDMVSKDVDSFLRLVDKDAKELAFDDDTGGDNNARIVFKCAKDDEYKIICTSYEDNPDFKNVGAYTLTVKKGTEEDLKKYLAEKQDSLLARESTIRQDSPVMVTIGRLPRQW